MSDKAPEACPFCGAKICNTTGDFECCTKFWFKDRKWVYEQSVACELNQATAERDRLIRERDEALSELASLREKHESAGQSAYELQLKVMVERDQLRARVKRLEEAGDELERDKQALRKILADLGATGSTGTGSAMKWAQAKGAKL